MAYNDDLRGVGGWLAFLIVVLVFLSPLRGLITTMSEISASESLTPEIVGTQEWGNLKIFYWIITLVQISFFIFAGYLLYNRHVKNTVFIAIFCIWFGGPFLNIAPLTILAIIYDGSIFADQTVVVQMAQSIAFSLIWTAYLLTSKRVKNTYYDGDPYAQYLEAEEEQA